MSNLLYKEWHLAVHSVVYLFLLVGALASGSCIPVWHDLFLWLPRTIFYFAICQRKFRCLLHSHASHQKAPCCKKQMPVVREH